MKRAIKRREVAQNRIVDRHLAGMDAFFAKLSEEIAAELLRSRRTPHVALRKIDVLLEQFYVDTVHEGLIIAKQEDPDKAKEAKLGFLPKARLPKNIRQIADLFQNRGAFRMLMKRREKLSAGLKRAYLARLNIAFQTIVPAVLSDVISIEDATRGIMSAWDSTRSRANTIFRMESTRYFAETQLSYFSDHPRIVGFLYDTIRDVSRTEICRSRHGLVYRVDSELLKENTPPNHFGCRAHLVPLADTEEHRKMLKDPRRDPTIVKVVPLPRGFKK